MSHKPPSPICKALLVCRKVIEQDREWNILGITNRVVSRNYPSGHQLGIFALFASAHGDYLVEAQLQTMDGEIVWREGPDTRWPMRDPLEQCNVILNLTIVFPKPGTYEIVLVANGEEIGREKMVAILVPTAKEQS